MSRGSRIASLSDNRLGGFPALSPRIRGKRNVSGQEQGPIPDTVPGGAAGNTRWAVERGSIGPQWRGYRNLMGLNMRRMLDAVIENTVILTPTTSTRRQAQEMSLLLPE
jgi:hypothetical protein